MPGCYCTDCFGCCECYDPNCYCCGDTAPLHMERNFVGELRPLRSLSEVATGLRLKLDPLAIRQRIWKKKAEMSRVKKSQRQKSSRNRQNFWNTGPKKMDVSSWAKGKQRPLPGDCAIVSATDERMFVGFQMLYTSIKLRHNIPVFLIDLGLNSFQKDWAENIGINIIPVSRLQLFTRSLNWQTWNKPLYIRAVPEQYRKVLWIDADCIVTDYLGEAFLIMDDRPFITRDTVAAARCNSTSEAALQNHPELYNLLPVDHRWNKRVSINAGVVGFDRERDFEVLDEWEYCVFEAFQTTRVRKLLRLYDQGALIWALERTGHVNKLEQAAWNDASLSKGHVNNMNFFAQQVASSRSKIIHFAGKIDKPWDGWDTSCLDFKSRPNTGSHRNLRFYFFCWDNNAFEEIKEGGYLKRLFAQNISTKFQVSYGQDRLFLSGRFEEFLDREYIGFGTGWWTKKKKPALNRLWLRQFKRNEIFTSKIYGEEWVKEKEKENRGYVEILNEISSVSGMDYTGETIDPSSVIMHKDVMKDWQKSWKMIYLYLHNNYGKKLVPSVYSKSDWTPHIPSMISMLYFSHNGHKFDFRELK